MPRFFSSKVSLRALVLLGVLYVVLNIVVWGLLSRDGQPKAVTGDAVERTARSGVRQTDESGLFPFDPNTADSATLVRLGLRSYVARNVMQYRRHHGVFRRATDFGRIYGLDSALAQRLEPYIIIGEAFQARPRPPRSVTRAFTSRQSGMAVGGRYSRDTARAVSRSVEAQSFPEKFHTLVKLDPNTVDSLTLLRIPGVGPGVAHGILRYRELLGGYVSPDQLAEVYYAPSDIAQWFSAPANPARAWLRLNEASFRDLLRHPYLTLDQVKAITRHRERFGPITHLDELSNYDVFTPQDLERLAPYAVLK